MTFNKTYIKKIKRKKKTELASVSAYKVRIKADLSIKESDLLQLKVSGNCQCEDCNIQSCISEGNIQAADTTFGSIIALDEGQFKNVKAQVFRNSAKIDANANIHKIGGQIKAVTYENYTSSVLDYEFDYQNILSKYFLEADREVKCNFFISYAPFYIPKLVAKKIYVLPFFNSNIEQMSADKVVIRNKFKVKEQLNEIPSLVSYRKLMKHSFETSRMKIDKIFAKSVEIENCDVLYLCADDVKIYGDCHIKCLESKNMPQIDNSCIIDQWIKKEN